MFKKSHSFIHGAQESKEEPSSHPISQVQPVAGCAWNSPQALLQGLDWLQESPDPRASQPRAAVCLGLLVGGALCSRLHARAS